MKNSIFLLFVLFLSGCASIETQQANLTAGRTGCPAEEIKITKDNISRWDGRGTWEASCKGKEFICSAAGPTVECKEKLK